jgi:hypothetical protein
MSDPCDDVIKRRDTCRQLDFADGAGFDTANSDAIDLRQNIEGSFTMTRPIGTKPTPTKPTITPMGIKKS